MSLELAMELTRKAFNQSESTAWAIAADTWYMVNQEEIGDICMFLYHARKWAIVRYLSVQTSKFINGQIYNGAVHLSFKNPAFPKGAHIHLDVLPPTAAILYAAFRIY